MAEAPVPPTTAAPLPAARPVDVQKLADKVYQLLFNDARVGRARVDSPLVPQRHGEG